MTANAMNKRRIARAFSSLPGFMRTRAAPSSSSAFTLLVHEMHEQNAPVILPYDILIQVLMHLELYDLLSASTVCRHFCEASKAFAIWLKFASETQKFFGFLALDPIKLQSCWDLSAADLQEAVARTRILHKNWLKDYAKPLETSVIHVKKFGLSTVTRVDDDDVALFFTCGRRLIYAYPGLPIEALDLETGLRSTSDHLIRNDSLRTALSSRFTLLDTNILFVEYQSSTEESSNPTITFDIVCVRLTPLVQEEQLQATVMNRFCLQGNFVFIQDTIDPETRLLCVLLADVNTSSLYLYVIFDWETGSSAKLFISSLVSIFTSDFSLEQQALMDKYKEQRGSITPEILRVSEDGRTLVISHPEALTRYSDSHLSLDILREYANPWPPEQDPDTVRRPLFERRITYRDHHGISFENETLHYVQILQQQLKLKAFESETLKICHLQVHVSHDDEWAIAQHYTPSSLELMPLAFGPLDPSLRRSLRGLISIMRDPVLDRGLPLMGLSFTHAVWIEQFEARRRGRRIGRKLRVMKILPFQSIYEDNVVHPRAMEVDVPKKVLNDAKHLIIEPSICSIIVIGGKDQVYKFRFA